MATQAPMPLIWKVLLLGMTAMLILLAISLVRYRWWQEADTHNYYLTRQLRQAQSHYQMVYEDYTLARQRHQRIMDDIRQETAVADNDALRASLQENLRQAELNAVTSAQRYSSMLEELAATINALHAELSPLDDQEAQP